MVKPKTICGLGMMHKGPFINPNDAAVKCQLLNKRVNK